MSWLVLFCPWFHSFFILFIVLASFASPNHCCNYCYYWFSPFSECFTFVSPWFWRLEYREWLYLYLSQISQRHKIISKIQRKWKAPEFSGNKNKIRITWLVSAWKKLWPPFPISHPNSVVCVIWLADTLIYARQDTEGSQRYFVIFFYGGQRGGEGNEGCFVSMFDFTVCLVQL